MPRDYKAYLSDIIGAVNKIERYTNNLSFQDFLQNELVQDGVVRNLEIIGEAVKKIPDHIKRKKPDIEWKKIAGLRDILIHDYFGIDVVIVWDIIKNKIPVLKKNILNLYTIISSDD